MTNETTQNFWEAFLNQPDIELPRVFYRLYHDSQGFPLFYSMEDVPGTYIEIDLETYRQSDPRVRVVDGKLTELTWRPTSKLVPSSAGSCCHPDNVAVIVAEDQPHVKWSKRDYYNQSN
jgi:hypothetical protein